MGQKITTAVIPIAGFGTRFLPASKTIPKEMLPIVDWPTLYYIVADAVKSGLKNIIIVTSADKKAAEDFFDFSPALESWLLQQGKVDLLKTLQKIPTMANFIFIRQKGPMGNGTPVLNARELIGDQPFVVLWGDEFFLTRGKPWIKQLLEAYQKFQQPICAVAQTDALGQSRYGIIAGKKKSQTVWQITDILEKPGPKLAPSNLAMVGGYVLTPDIFPILAKTKQGKGQELWLADALQALNKKRPFYAKIIQGELYDAGTIEGWLEANVLLALKNPKYKKEFSQFLKKVVK